MIATGAALSTASDARQAAMEAALAARGSLDGGRPSLAAVFVSAQHERRCADIVDAVHEAVGPDALIGCMAEGVVGGDREVEEGPGVSVWLARFPGAVETFAMEFLPAGEGGIVTGWPEGDGGRVHLLVCDPFTFPADAFLAQVNEHRPGTVLIGGMAGGGAGPGATRLFRDAEVLSAGAVGVRLPDGVRVRTVVSQGCRPLGEGYVVTRAQGNVIEELAGRPPLERLRELYASVAEEDRALMAQGLHIGRVIDEYKPSFERGDFLIRGVVGADHDRGAIAVGDTVAVGQTVRFHVRDAESADEDLRSLLGGSEPPAGALLFTCNGRGSRMFPVPDHDASVVSEQLGRPPLAGFFCAGELGPVGGRNFLHGFTASLALFYEDDAVRD